MTLKVPAIGKDFSGKGPVHIGLATKMFLYFGLTSSVMTPSCSMIEMAVALALQCTQPQKPKPIQYTRQQRLQDAFKDIARQPNSPSFLRSETVYQRLNLGPYLP